MPFSQTAFLSHWWVKCEHLPFTVMIGIPCTYIRWRFQLSPNYFAILFSSLRFCRCFSWSRTPLQDASHRPTMSCTFSTHPKNWSLMVSPICWAVFLQLIRCQALSLDLPWTNVRLFPPTSSPSFPHSFLPPSFPPSFLLSCLYLFNVFSFKSANYMPWYKSRTIHLISKLRTTSCLLIAI